MSELQNLGDLIKFGYILLQNSADFAPILLQNNMLIIKIYENGLVRKIEDLKI